MQTSADDVRRRLAVAYFHFHRARQSYKPVRALLVTMLAANDTRELRTRRRIEITELSADTVDDYVRTQGLDAVECSLERRGARTYLVVDS